MSRRDRPGRHPPSRAVWSRIAARGSPIAAVVLATLLLAPGITSAGTDATHRVTPVASFSDSSSNLPTSIRHVFVIFLENQARSTVLSKGPYERYLAGHYAQATQYYAICHHSAPNYLSTISGEPFQCGSDAYHVYSATNIGSLLGRAGISNWAGYMENMPAPCSTSSSGLYAVKHNPFVYFQDIVSNRVFCDQHDVSLTVLNNQLSSGTVPAFAWITPNLNHDGHDTGVPQADAWLKGWLSPWLNKSWFGSSVFFITYDESGTSDTTGYGGLNGGHVYFVAVSPLVVHGGQYASDASHYSLLSTIEWLLGLGSTGHHDGTAQFPAMKSLFSSGLPP